MKELTYLILHGINVGSGPVTWYQLDRMIRSRGLHKYLNSLIEHLNQLEKEELLIQKFNDDKPKILTLTKKGIDELDKLKEIYG